MINLSNGWHRILMLRERESGKEDRGKVDGKTPQLMLQNNEWPYDG